MTAIPHTPEVPERKRLPLNSKVVVMSLAKGMEMSDTTEICCLCGRPATDGDPITDEHVPPKQFYPKSLRDGLNLWTVRSHGSCNNGYKQDEEYFFHVLYPLVDNANPQTADVILDDLKRRAKKPQTPALLRRILKTKGNTTESGIILPPGAVRLDAEMPRIERVAVKIGRCLFYRDQKRFMPYENCKDIRLCEREEDVPEMYSLSWGLSKVSVGELTETRADGLVVVEDSDAGKALAACRQVFDYRPAYIEQDRLHFYSLRFWESFLFCMVFEDPATAPSPTED